MVNERSDTALASAHTRRWARKAKRSICVRCFSLACVPMEFSSVRSRSPCSLFSVSVCSDGSVSIYDIRDTSSKPALESAHSSGKHSEPVWGIKWVAKELNKRSQQLTSISTDGSVKQWNMKKGLVPHELMQLKRIPNRAAQLSASSSASGGTTMEGLSREASGMCFDFPINDGTQYFAGTEDGLIHKCSVSYNEQTLENFYGHTGPVYKVRCSPFLPDAFLSCSADWSAMLWSQKQPSKPVLRLAAGGHDSLMDIVWSPNHSTMFALVSREGRVEVWDLAASPLDPIVKLTIPQVSEAERERRDAERKARELAIANAPLTHADGGALLDPTAANKSAAQVAAAAAGGAAGSLAATDNDLPPRFLSCVSFSAIAPILLVGTSDGCIEVFRLEGSALTSVPPPPEVLAGLDAAALAQQNLQTYGQSLNAATVMQVPRDRDRDRDGNHDKAALSLGESLLQTHQDNIARFREQAHRLETVMDQHNDSKSQTHRQG